NFVARIVLPDPIPALSIEVDLVVELEAYDPFDFFLEPWAEKYPFEHPAELRADLGLYLERGPPGPLFPAFVERGDRSPKNTISFLVDVNRRVKDAVRYIIRHEPGVFTPERTLEHGEGSCRDSAWLLVHVLRHLGLAARFVSGYLIQLAPDQPPLEGP